MGVFLCSVEKDIYLDKNDYLILFTDCNNRYQNLQLVAKLLQYLEKNKFGTEGRNLKGRSHE